MSNFDVILEIFTSVWCFLFCLSFFYLSYVFVKAQEYTEANQGVRRKIISQSSVFSACISYTISLNNALSLNHITFSFRGRSKNCFRVAIRRLQKSWQYAYRDRRRKRREWSKFWIQRIQAGVRQYSWRYSQFMGSYKNSGIKLDRKVGFLEPY
jgi:large subunit ribosomal protein L20